MKIGALLRDRLWQSLLAVIVVLVLAVGYLFQSVLDLPLFGGTKTVSVELTAAGGLFEGAAVTYRGIKIGKVREIEITPTGARASLFITATDDIPASSKAVVRSLSPVGEQYLDFQPETTDGPYLADGDVIEASATELPKTLASTVVAVQSLLDQIDPTDLQTLLTELATGLAGTGAQVGKLVDQGTLLLADLDRVWPETDRLITRGNRVLDIGASRATEIRELGTSARQFAKFLKEYTPEFRQTLRNAPGQIQQLRALVADAGEVLPGFLGTAVKVTTFFRAYQPHFGTLLQEYAPGFGSLDKAIWDRAMHLAIEFADSTRCHYGTTELPPTRTERRPMRLDAECPASAPNLKRGAAHAPGPIR